MHTYESDLIIDKKYSDCLNSIKSSCNNIWERPLMNWYTDHSMKHSQRIGEILSQLILRLSKYKQALNEQEKFILFASVYLHDIGMQYMKIEDVPLDELSQEDYERIRVEHAKKSAEIIKANTDILNIPSEYRTYIADVSEGHSSKYFDVIIKKYSDKITYSKNEILRIRLLTALLLLADELDLTSARVNFNFLDIANISNISKLHWYKHSYIDAVIVNDIKIEIKFTFPEEKVYTDLFMKLVQTKVLQQLNKINSVFRNESDGILYFEEVVVSKEIDRECGKRKFPSKLYTTLQEHASDILQKNIPCINGYKLFYYREKAKLSLNQLSKRTKINQSFLKKIEGIGIDINQRPITKKFFNSMPQNGIRSIENVLNCRGELLAGQESDFLSKYIEYYIRHKTKISNQNSTRKHFFVPKAVVFDFDGTLTLSNKRRTTWEDIWVYLKYTTEDCAQFQRQYASGEISHQEWCDISRDWFKRRDFSQDMLVEVAKKIKLLPGAIHTIRELQRAGKKLFILSGSIKQVIEYVLKDTSLLFEDIQANRMSFDENHILENIVGTEYDFHGKAEYLTHIINEYGYDPLEVLYIGNSCNDNDASKSGVITLCVNPSGTNWNDTNVWNDVIREMSNLKEILQYVN
jgi:HAD superfamily phosphoserine phosphatase-like hydrolase